MYLHLWLANFMITLTTEGKPQGVSIYVIFIAFMASFVILTDEYFRFLKILIWLVFYCDQKATEKWI